MRDTFRGRDRPATACGHRQIEVASQTSENRVARGSQNTNEGVCRGSCPPILRTSNGEFPVPEFFQVRPSPSASWSPRSSSQPIQKQFRTLPRACVARARSANSTEGGFSQSKEDHLPTRFPCGDLRVVGSDCRLSSPRTSDVSHGNPRRREPSVASFQLPQRSALLARSNQSTNSRPYA